MCCLSAADMEWPKRLEGRLLYDAATTYLWVDGARDVGLGVLVIYAPLGGRYVFTMLVTALHRVPQDRLETVFNLLKTKRFSVI
jgi:hypothetical protein